MIDNYNLDTLQIIQKIVEEDEYDDLYQNQNIYEKLHI